MANVSISKTGIVSSEMMSEFITNGYDKNIYTEPDGSSWIRIVHHNNPASYKFASNNSFATRVYLDDNRWFYASLCNFFSGTWELMVKQTTTSGVTETKYRWIQKANPMTATYDQTLLANVTVITNGYSTVTNYGGIYLKNSNTYLCVNNANSGNWMGAIGCWTAWNGGIPAWGSTAVSTGYLDLYLRIDDKGSYTKNSFYTYAVTSPELIEI